MYVEYQGLSVVLSRCNGGAGTSSIPGANLDALKILSTPPIIFDLAQPKIQRDVSSWHIAADLRCPRTGRDRKRT